MLVISISSLPFDSAHSQPELTPSQAAHRPRENPRRSFKNVLGFVSDVVHGPALRSAAYIVLTNNCSQVFLQRDMYGATCVKSIRSALRFTDCEGAKLKDILCFPDRFVQIMKQPDTEYLLRKLNNELLRAVREKSIFDLWKWTLATKSGDQEKALEWIAVLFQEQSLRHLKISAEQRLGKDFDLTTYASVLKNLHQFGNQNSQFVKLYPLQKILPGPGLYHFYVSAYLAQSLAKRLNKESVSGLTNEQASRESVAITVMFNESYEYHHVVSRNFIDRLTGERIYPGNYDLSHNVHSLKASYMAYVGALWATNLPGQETQIVDFATTFARDPSEFIIKILSGQ